MCNPQLGPRPTALLWTRQSKQEWNVRVKSISSTLSCTLIQRMLLCLPLVAGWSSSSDLLLTAGRWPVGKMVESYAFDFENFLFDALLCFSSRVTHQLLFGSERKNSESTWNSQFGSHYSFRDQILLNLLNVMNVESLARKKKILCDFPEKLQLTKPEITTVQYSLCNTYGQFQDWETWQSLRRIKLSNK